MRFLIALLFVSLLAPVPALSADEALDWYLKGNEFSQKGQFEQAVEARTIKPSRSTPTPRGRFTTWVWPTNI